MTTLLKRPAIRAFCGICSGLMLLVATQHVQSQPPEAPVSTLGEDSADLGAMPEEGLNEVAGPSLAERIPLPTDASEAEIGELERFQRALSSYEREAAEYRADVSRLAQLEHQERARDVHGVYDGAIDSLRDEERRLRLDAIERLLAFVNRYPDHPAQTPDAMFRLAELTFELESDEFVAADDEYIRLLALFDLGEVAEPPIEPQKDYQGTVAWFRRLIADFPDYQQVDGAYYLMGTALQQMGEDEDANEAFLALARDFPESEFAQEGWVRLGENAFELNDYDSAAIAYTRALEYGSEGRLYDEALFKLGWAYYLDNRYQDALDSFVSLINLYDQNEETDATSGALREEALQYLAVVLAEMDWNLDGERDVDAGLPRVRAQLSTGAPWELDVLDRLTEVWFDSESYELGVEGFRFAMEQWPNDRETPARNERIVVALSRMNDVEAAFAEQLTFGERYGSGSEWHTNQMERGNIQAMAYADELVRTSLLDSARYYNQQADLLRDQSLLDPDLDEQAIEMFRVAAAAYADFLENYPGDREAYEVRFLFAQALYHSFDFLEAAAEYRAIAASPGPRQELAAYQVVRSVEGVLTDEISRGALDAHAMPNWHGSEEDDSSYRATDRGPLSLHPLSEMLVTAYDEYVELGTSPTHDPTVRGRFAFLAGKTHFDHNQMEEARVRFEVILENPVFRAQESGLLAASLLIESYRIDGDFEAMELCAVRIGELEFGGDVDPAILVEFGEDTVTQRLSAVFQQARQLFDAEDYEAATLSYLELVNQYPNSELAPIALNNAAVAYEREDRFELVLDLYERLVADYPESEFVSEILFQIAVTNRRFFDFERAIQAYLLFASRGDVGVERVQTALFSAAELQQLGEQYSDAGTTYERFVADFENNENVPIALYRAGLMYELDGSYNDMERVWRQLRQQSTDTISTVEIPVDAITIDSLRRTADYYAEVIMDNDEAERLYSDVLDECALRGADDIDSRFSAAKALFWLTERDFEVWRQIEIVGTTAEQRLAITQLAQDIVPLVESYMEIPGYNSAEWTIAAYNRAGHVYQSFADTLWALPLPDDCDNLEVCYSVEREQVMYRLEDEAVENWRFAVEIARETGIVNEWTIDTIRQLNRHLGDEFPLHREEIEYLQDAIISPVPMSGPTHDEGFEEGVRDP